MCCFVQLGWVGMGLGWIGLVVVGEGFGFTYFEAFPEELAFALLLLLLLDGMLG